MFIIKQIEFIYLFIAFLKYLYNEEEEEGEEKELAHIYKPLA